MPDSHTPEQRSYNMSRIRSRGTAPERRLGELLQTLYPNQTLLAHPPDLPGKPDWWLPELRMAFFADGCFFHRCPRHFILPLNNQDYWKRKIAGNKTRDHRANRLLREQNICPVRLWEHDLRQDFTAARRKIRYASRRWQAKQANLGTLSGEEADT